jgi:hypothetical protein
MLAGAAALLAGATSYAENNESRDENLAGFGEIGTPPAASYSDPFGPVETEKISLANEAPVLLPYFNNGPVFGLPGTQLGGLRDRTQLTGEWGGSRTNLTRSGLFSDLYTTSAWQDVTSGGIKTGSAFVQNTQLSLNLDTGRAGWWDGGLIHFALQSRYGGSVADTYSVGSAAPQYYGLAFPDPFLTSTTLPAEYYLSQAFGEKFSVILGKINGLYIPDQTLFANNYKFYFANYNFNKNPIYMNFFNPMVNAAIGIYKANEWLTVAGGVLDPYSRPDNLANDAFKDVNLYMTAIATYNIAGRPGQFMPSFNWSNQPQLNLASPYGALAPAQIPQAVGALVGGSAAGLPVNNTNHSYFVIANMSQYLWVFDEPSQIAGKMKSGQELSGIGVFARGGYAPPSTNTISSDVSVGLFGHGLLASRAYDSVGVGYYHNEFSSDLKSQVSLLTGGFVNVKNEDGMEVFYDYALTPSIHIIPSYQHIWNPLIAQVASGQDHADVVLIRGTVVF